MEKTEDKVLLYMSYQDFEKSRAGIDFFDFIDKELQKAIERGMSEDNPDARGKYQFIRALQSHISIIKRESEEIQKRKWR